jgi:uncharacterized phage-associated protein
MTVTAQKIANLIIETAHERAIPISNMKLQKLVYLSYGWFFAITDEKLFEDDIQAWKFGPVIPSIYHKFKMFFSNPIPQEHFFKGDSGGVDDDHKGLVNKIFDVYGAFSAEQLSNKTHEKNTPWDKAYTAGCSNIVINDNDIKEHFKLLLN